MTETNIRRLKRAIKKAWKNGWEPSGWPLNDGEFEIDCHLSAGELLWDKGFQKAIGRIEWIKLVNRLTDSVMTYSV